MTVLLVIRGRNSSHNGMALFQDTVSTAGVDALGSVACYTNISWAQRVSSASPFVNDSLYRSGVYKYISQLRFQKFYPFISYLLYPLYSYLCYILYSLCDDLLYDIFGQFVSRRDEYQYLFAQFKNLLIKNCWERHITIKEQFHSQRVSAISAEKFN